MLKRGQVLSASPLGKSGQVTVFLIIGIVMLLLAAGFFFIFGNIKKAPLEVESEVLTSSLRVRSSLQGFVENCIEETMEPSLYLLAIQGGSIYLDENSQMLFTDNGFVNYAWLNGINGISKEKMESDLSEYLVNNIDYCLGFFESFITQGLVVQQDYENINFQVTIGDTSINVELNFPISAELADGTTVKLDQFSKRMQSSLGKLFRTIQSLNFPEVDIASLADLQYISKVFPYDSSSTIYSLTDDTHLNAPLAFMFVVRDDFPNNHAPELDYISDKTFKLGDRWDFTLTAEDQDNDILKFSSNSNLVNVNNEGDVTAVFENVGVFEILFKVDDGRGGEDVFNIKITVVE